MSQNEVEEQREREFRRQVVAEWKQAAKALAGKNHNALQREARREAIAIIEDAARTPMDFEKVLIIWDEIERIEGWRIEKHKKGSTEELRDRKLTERDVFIPQPIDHVYYRQEIKGQFLDTIYDCPHEIHETTSSKPVYDVTEELDELHKELLYYRSIRFWSPQQIAAVRGQTDRNIRKVYNKMVEDIRYELFYFLYWRYKKYLPLTTTQREHVIAGIKRYGDDKNREEDWELNKEDLADDEKNIADDKKKLTLLKGNDKL